jgi:hypothetical protein
MGGLDQAMRAAQRVEPGEGAREPLTSSAPGDWVENDQHRLLMATPHEDFWSLWGSINDDVSKRGVFAFLPERVDRYGRRYGHISSMIHFLTSTSGVGRRWNVTTDSAQRGAGSPEREVTICRIPSRGADTAPSSSPMSTWACAAAAPTSWPTS